MKTRLKTARGQSIVETIILLPLMLILLAGGWWAFQNISLSDAVESAAHTHLIRTGRNLPSITSELSKTIHSGENSVLLEGKNHSLVGKIPFFSGLSGNTFASAGVSCQKEQVGAFIDLPDHDLKREAEAAIDCWGKDSRSGSVIQTSVLALIGVGLIK